MILVAVGTFVHGFDELIEAADHACAELALPGLAQIGHSRAIPRWLGWQRFLSPQALGREIARARAVVCHGGMGLLGDAMRAGRPIVAVPRRGATTAAHPAGDQLAFLRRLAERQPIRLCESPGNLKGILAGMLAADEAPVSYDLETDLPDRLAEFLKATSAGKAG